jgi:cell division protein FtsB
MMLDYPLKIFWFLLVMAGFVLVIGVFNGETSYSNYQDLANSRAVLEKTITDLKSENDKTQEEIIKLKNSKSYARKVLRDQYHIVDEDEEIIFFAD